MRSTRLQWAYLAGVNVAAETVNVRVVGEHEAVSGASSRGNVDAVISALDDVDVGAVLPGDTQAQGLQVLYKSA